MAHLILKYRSQGSLERRMDPSRLFRLSLAFKTPLGAQLISDNLLLHIWYSCDSHQMIGWGQEVNRLPHMLLPSFHAWAGVGASWGVLGLCKGVRVARMLIGVKDLVEYFTGHGLSGTSHALNLPGCSKKSEKFMTWRYAFLLETSWFLAVHRMEWLGDLLD